MTNYFLLLKSMTVNPNLNLKTISCLLGSSKIEKLKKPIV